MYIYILYIPYMGQIVETGAYFGHPPAPHLNVGDVVWEELRGAFMFRFRNSLEMGRQEAERDFHNCKVVLVSITCPVDGIVIYLVI